MLVIIKSSSATPEGERALKLAREMGSDICLVQNAVYFAQEERSEGCCGTVYVLNEDRRLRGLKDDDMGKGIRNITYDEFVDLLTGNEKVIGMF